jgi:hypothetical protein
MNAIANALRELVGLIVDDRGLALSIVAVVALAALMSLVPGAGPAAGGVLVFGCLAVLTFSVMKAAR